MPCLKTLCALIQLLPATMDSAIRRPRFRSPVHTLFARPEFEAFVLIAKLHQVGNRNKYFLNCAEIVGLPGEKAGPNVEPIVPTHLNLSASQNDLSPGMLPILQVPEHALLLLFADQRPHLRFGIEPVANSRIFQAHFRGLDESLIDAFVNDPPCSRAT